MLGKLGRPDIISTKLSEINVQEKGL